MKNSLKNMPNWKLAFIFIAVAVTLCVSISILTVQIIGLYGLPISVFAGVLIGNWSTDQYYNFSSW